MRATKQQWSAGRLVKSSLRACGLGIADDVVCMSSRCRARIIYQSDIEGAAQVGGPNVHISGPLSSRSHLIRHEKVTTYNSAATLAAFLVEIAQYHCQTASVLRTYCRLPTPSSCKCMRPECGDACSSPPPVVQLPHHRFSGACDRPHHLCATTRLRRRELVMGGAGIISHAIMPDALPHVPAPFSCPPVVAPILRDGWMDGRMDGSRGRKA
ncbi:hypothetical protein F4780DRAFT_759674 [Xylariomycetidae sp. FL0641]|nr:hypothetical protein F4780DRAFT_759674 [Xylariomycetidae sp. FL0641]